MMNNMYLVGFQHPKGLCYVSDKLKVIFVPIPKNASTSVRNITGFEFRADNIMAYSENLAAGDYKAFAIIREPVPRFISGYIEVCQRASGDSPHILTRDFYWMRGKNRFLKFLEEIEHDWFDAHLFPQEYFLCDYAGNPFMIDAYLDIKQLSTAIPIMLSKYGTRAPLSFPKLNVHGKEQHIGFPMMGVRKIDAVYVRRSFYYIMDYVVRQLQRKSVPTSAEVHNILCEDRELLPRIEKLLADDIAFLDRIKKDMVFDPSGIYWRRA